MASGCSAQAINIMNQEFWKQQSCLESQRIANPVIATLALKQFELELERGFRSCRSLGAHLMDAEQCWQAAEAPARRLISDELSQAKDVETQKMGEAFRAAQRTRAKKPRGKITEDGTTIFDIVRKLAASPAHTTGKPKRSYGLISSRRWRQEVASLRNCRTVGLRRNGAISTPTLTTSRRLSASAIFKFW